MAVPRPAASQHVEVAEGKPIPSSAIWRIALPAAQLHAPARCATEVTASARFSSLGLRTVDGQATRRAAERSLRGCIIRLAERVHYVAGKPIDACQLRLDRQERGRMLIRCGTALRSLEPLMSIKQKGAPGCRARPLGSSSNGSAAQFEYLNSGIAFS